MRYHDSFVKELTGVVRGDKNGALLVLVLVVVFFLRDLEGAGGVLPVSSPTSAAPALPGRANIVLLSCNI